MTPAEAGPVIFEPMAARSPLAQLLHALNQPVTGLQCSMEVALAKLRTPEEYVEGLRQGLELTERMRALVEAIREVADGLEEDKNDEDKNNKAKNKKAKNGEELAPGELAAILREAVDELQPVAESRHVSLGIDCGSSFALRAGRERLTGAVFRLLESGLALAAERTEMRIEAGSAPGGEWLRLRWEGDRSRPAGSRAELGLLLAQAGFERCGAQWKRERDGTQETVTITLGSISRGGETSRFL